jgi:hypothetical protein
LDGLVPFIADDLRPFLRTLQELVHDKIMEYDDIAVVSKAMIALIDHSNRTVLCGFEDS